jgi:ParB-like chromosome segregation protein Spo0J
MDPAKRKALEAAGWRFGDYSDLLDLSEEERQLVELRLAVSREFRRLRAKAKLTQKDVGKKLKTSQPRVARMESAADNVSLDQMFLGFFSLGGKVGDVVKGLRGRAKGGSKKVTAKK